MNGYLERVIQGFRRAETWLKRRTFPAAVGSVGVEPALVLQSAALETVVAAFTAAVTAEAVAVREVKGAAAEARKLRADLRKQLPPMASVAAVALPDVVKMTEALRAPRGNVSDEKLLAQADAMVQEAGKYQPELVAAGLPAGFIEQLSTKATALRSAINARGVALADRRGAAKRVKEAHVAGRLVMDTVGTLLKHHLSDDPAAYAEWQQLKRITNKGVRGSVAATASATAVPVSQQTA